MDIVIVCHTEFGYVYDKRVIFDKSEVKSISLAVRKLKEFIKKYKIKITFALCPEVSKYFPLKIDQEIGLHIHPGWQEFQYKKLKWVVGDEYLRRQYKTSISSTVLRDYPYRDQFKLIKIGKDYLENLSKRKIRTFVSGRWSVNNETIQAIIKNGLVYDCSPLPASKTSHYDWSKLARISFPYHPAQNDYQKEGDLSLLIVPTSQYFPKGCVSPESIPEVGIGWLKACFLEYYQQDAPLFHICFHSPSMTSSYFISGFEAFLKFISKYKVEFKFVSEIKKYKKIIPQTNIYPYFRYLNKDVIKTFLKQKVLKHLIKQK
jgi:hypothetical protein